MATTPTQLPVPSEKPQDLKFNAGKIDEFVTSMGWTYTDRFGNKHYTIEGINYLAQQVMSAFGYVTLTGVNFTTGTTVSTPNEVLFNQADNSYYKWTGSFAVGGKVVPLNSTPESTGGIGPGKWLSVGDTVLRNDLASPSGAALVNNGADTIANQINKLLKDNSNVYHVDNEGAVGDGVLSSDKLTITGTDDTAAFIAAFAKAKAAGGGRVICSPGKTYLITYTLLYPSNLTFDGQGATLLFNPKNGDASLFLPETFQVADDTTYTTDVILRNFKYKQIQNADTVQGNLLGVMKGRRILMEDVYVDWLFWHVFDGAGGKECVVRRVNCNGGHTVAMQFDSSGNGNSAAVYAVDAAGAKLPCASSPGYAGFTYSENCFITDCVINNFNNTNFPSGAVHWHGGGTRSTFIIGNKINNCLVGLRSDVNTEHNEVVIANNVIGNCPSTAIMQAQHTNISSTGNIFFSGTTIDGQYAWVGNDSATTLKRGFVFNNNTIIGFGRGVQLHNYVGVDVNNNTFRGVGAGLPTSASDVLISAISAIVLVDCSVITVNCNTFAGCNVRSCINVKASTDASKVGPASITGNTSSSSGPGVVVRGLVNPIVNGNSIRTMPGCYIALAEVACNYPVISGNAVNAPDGQAVIYSSGAGPLVSSNNLQLGVTTGYGVQFAAASSPRSSMNNIGGGTAASQVYLDSGTAGGKHCEPFATIGKHATASGMNYTPAGVAL